MASERRPMLTTAGELHDESVKCVMAGCVPAFEPPHPREERVATRNLTATEVVERAATEKYDRAYMNGWTDAINAMRHQLSRMQNQ